MKIAVCGVNNSELLKKIENHYGVESVNVFDNIYDSAKSTYDYDDKEVVVFNGCVLDYIDNDKDIHPFDEQVVLCALDNIDVVYVYIQNMTSNDINKYHQFYDIHKVKVVDVVDVNTFNIN